MRLDTVDRTGWFINRKVLSGPLIFLSVFALAAIPRLLFLDYFLMVDENLWYERSARFLQGLVSGNLAQTVQTGHPGVTTMWSGTMGLLLYYLQTAFPNESLLHFADRMVATPATLATLSLLRLPLALLSALSVAAALLLGRRLLGWGAALGGAALMAFEPLFLAHSRVLHHDSPAADFSLLAVLAWLLYLKTERRRYQVLAGIGVALATLSKVSCVFLLGFAGLTLLPMLWQHRPPCRLGRGTRPNIVGFHIRSTQPTGLKLAAARWLGLAAVTGLVVVLAWPAVWAAPVAVGNTIAGFITSESGAHANGTFFMGRPVDDAGPLYYPLGLAFALTPLTLAGILLAVLGLGLAWALRRRAQVPEAGRSHYRWAAWLLLYAVLFVAYMSVIGKKQERYVLPAVVAFDLLAGWGYWHVVDMLNRALGRPAWFGPQASLPTFLVLVILLAGQYDFAWSAVPYYSTFYNPLLGGGRVAQKLLLVGRGEGLEQAVRYIQAQTGDRVPQVASWYGTTVTTLFDGGVDVKDVSHPQYLLGSDYIIFYINQWQRQLPKESILRYVGRNTPDHIIRLGDIDYAVVYRGQAIAHEVDPFAAGNRLVGKASLTGFDFEQVPVAGAQVPLRLYWVNDGMGPEDRFYVRLTDAQEGDWAWGPCAPDPAFGDAGTWQKDDIIESECQLIVYPGTPPGDYLLRAGVMAQDGTVIGQINLSAEEGTVTVGRPPEYPGDEWVPVEHETRTSLNADLGLIGYDYTSAARKPGESVPIVFYWRALQPIADDYTLRLSLQGEGPGQDARWEGAPVAGRYPTHTWQANEVVRDPWLLKLPVSLPGGTYDLSLTLVSPAGRASASLPLDTFAVEGREHSFVLESPPSQAQAARLGEDMRLIGYDLAGAVDGQRLLPGGQLEVTLTWQADATPERNYTVFVQLLDQANHVLAQHDGQPGHGTLITSTWAPGEYVRDEHRLALPADLPAGDYRLIAGMYLADGGQRLSVMDESGQPLGDYITLNTPLRVP
jgi:hypothetical protein